MGALFGDAVGNFVVTVCSIFLLTRFSVASQLLAGLQIYKTQPKDSAGNEATPRRSGKQERKAAKLAAKQEIQIGGAEKILRYGVPKGAVEGADYSQDLELLVNAGFVLLLNFAAAALPLSSYKLANWKWPLWCASGCPMLAAWALLKVELLTGQVTRRDKYLVCGLCAIMAAAAASILELVPRTILDFRWEAAAQELGWTLTAAVRKLHVSPGDVPEMVVSAMVLKMVLATAAGLIGGLLASGALRASRSLMLALSPPPATRQYISFGVLPVGLMQLAAGLPVVCALLWVKPLIQEPLGWTDNRMRWLQAAFTCLLAVVQIVATRPLTQAYLNSSLVVWWTNKHAVTSADSKTSRMGEFIALKVDFINVVLCKVAVQMLAPAMLWGACGSLLCFAAWRDAAQAQGWSSLPWPMNLLYGTQQDFKPWVPTTLLTSAAGFMAWWTSACWFGFTAVVLSMHRLGLLPV